MSAHRLLPRRVTRLNTHAALVDERGFEELRPTEVPMIKAEEHRRYPDAGDGVESDAHWRPLVPAGPAEQLSRAHGRPSAQEVTAQGGSAIELAPATTACAIRHGRRLSCSREYPIIP